MVCSYINRDLYNILFLNAWWKYNFFCIVDGIFYDSRSDKKRYIKSLCKTYSKNSKSLQQKIFQVCFIQCSDEILTKKKLLYMLKYVLKTHNTCKQRVGGSMLILGIIHYYNSSIGWTPPAALWWTRGIKMAPSTQVSHTWVYSLLAVNINWIHRVSTALKYQQHINQPASTTNKRYILNEAV